MVRKFQWCLHSNATNGFDLNSVKEFSSKQMSHTPNFNPKTKLISSLKKSTQKRDMSTNNYI